MVRCRFGGATVWALVVIVSRRVGTLGGMRSGWRQDG